MSISSPEPQSTAPIAAPQVVAAATPAPRPRVWPVFLTLVATVVAVFGVQIGFAVCVAVWLLLHDVKPAQLAAELTEALTQPAAFIGLAGLSQITMGAAALVAAWFSPVPLAHRLGFVRSIWSARETVIVLLGALVPLAIGVSSAYALARVISPDPSLEKLNENMTLAWFLVFIPFIALAPGFNEEMLFRGYMQRRLLARFNPWLGLMITSVVFGLFHVMPHAIAAAFPLGVWLGLMAWRSGSIWPGILCHALVNGLWNVRGMAVKFDVIPEQPPPAVLIVLALIGVPAFFWSLRIMFGRAAPAYAAA
jgi:membrane protease YdiL (CAAX protease family)